MSKWYAIPKALTSVAIAATAMFAPMAYAGGQDMCASEVRALNLAMGDGEGAFIFNQDTAVAAQKLKKCKEKNGQEVSKGLLDTIQKAQAAAARQNPSP